MIKIYGNDYDIKHWRKWHPGGIMIEVPLQDGTDYSDLYDSYHPPKIMKTKEKFYLDLKEKVHSLNINLRESPIMYIKAAFILLMCYTSWIQTFVYQRFIFSFLMGFFKAMVGVNIQHDANHGAFSSKPFVNEIMGYTLDFFGASSYIWKQTHVGGHHIHTNHDKDPDIRTSDPDVRRITQNDTWRWYHKYQYVYLPILYSFLSIKSCFIDDFIALKDGKVGHVNIKPMSKHDKTMFWTFKMMYFTLYVFIPLSMMNFWTYTIHMTCSELTTGAVLANLFQVAHVTPESTFWHSNSKQIGWAEKQVMSSCDFAPGNMFWTHVSGGLNHQVIHHLFPGVNHCHYPRLWKIVQKICKKHDIQYTYYDTYSEALSAHYKLNKLMSLKK